MLKSMHPALLGALALPALMVVASPAQASDSPFGYVYITDIHPKGTWEVEQWLTQSQGQSRGSYRNVQSRTELEYGLANHLQGSIYFNANSVHAAGNEPDGSTGGKFVPDGTVGSYQKTQFDSVSAELIYQLKDPYLNGYGLALYVEPTYGDKHKELEGKVLLQKNFLDDRLIWAGNMAMSFENDGYSGQTEKETEVELSTGLAWQVAQHWHIGYELVNTRGYSGHSLDPSHREYSMFQAGPSVHYGQGKFWTTLTWLPQLSGARAYTAAFNQQIVDGKIYHEAGTKDEIRLKIGYSF